MADKPNYFDPLTLSKLSTLLLRARYVVEGLISGLHTSPYKGFSVEFSEHRQYAPGSTATTSRNTRRRPISAVTCWSMPARR
jgi:hypothetical protein